MVLKSLFWFCCQGKHWFWEFIYNNNKLLDHSRQIAIENPVKLILISMVNDLKLLSCGSNRNPCFEGLKCIYTKIYFSKCTLDAEMWFTHFWFIPSNISILQSSINEEKQLFSHSNPSIWKIFALSSIHFTLKCFSSFLFPFYRFFSRKKLFLFLISMNEIDCSIEFSFFFFGSK